MWRACLAVKGELLEIPRSDKEVLRDLGRKVFEIATSKVNEEYVEMQESINRLEIIYVYEIPWHEMNICGEIDLKTKHPLYRR